MVCIKSKTGWTILATVSFLAIQIPSGTPIMIETKLDTKTNVKVLIKSDHKFWLAIRSKPKKVNNGKPHFLPHTSMANTVNPMITIQLGIAVKPLVMPFIRWVPPSWMTLKNPLKVVVNQLTADSTQFAIGNLLINTVFIGYCTSVSDNASRTRPRMITPSKRPLSTTASGVGAS